MKYSNGKLANWPFILVFTVALASAGFGQASAQPFLEDIRVHSEVVPQPSGTPLVRRTGSTVPAASAPAPAGRAIRTSIPVLAEAAIPGNSGVLVETLDGNLVVESGSDLAFNPASNVKIATAYAILKTFGPDYRFPTNVWTDGSYEEATGTIYGNLYVSGRDPVFVSEHGVLLASELNRMGIRVVKGDLVVTDNFSINYSTSPLRSAQALFATLDSGKRPAAASRAWSNFLINSGRLNLESAVPSVTFTGGVYVQPMPGNVNLLFSHESPAMRDVLKATLCYSNNFLSERLGDMVGGPFGVARLVHQHAGVTPQEFSIQTSSGLGINRVTPSAMMKLLRVLRRDLSSYKMTFADIMPVAGIDRGTLENRFKSDFSLGSVVGKTGTLGNTDGGVSALAGEINTRGGKFLFVIFNQRGSVARFRSFQNSYVSLIQGQFGGPSSLSYTEIPLNARLAKVRITYPDGRRPNED
ncbi:MAG TPA: D-alanyl-D-alanine carboxypeptidase [Pyrinomonadaceae bacterium]|nr:D-alanyl-D-alanine carboxypeptidase [Pyrinomonadaceae bacterium]